MTEAFNFEDALKAIQSGQAITGKDGVLAPLVKQLTEAALSAELDTYLEETKGSGNRRNGYSKKTVKSTHAGSFELETPRDREGEFEPERGVLRSTASPERKTRAMLTSSHTLLICMA